MKVTNNKIGGPSTHGLDSTRSSNAEKMKNDLTPFGVGAGSVRDHSKVDVSERAQMMQKAKAIASNSDIDEAKVARLQKLIDEGNYKIDSDKIADRLIGEHMQMPDIE